MRRVSLAALAVIAVLGIAPGLAGAAITGRVYLDYNSNGAINAGGYVTGAAASVTATDAGVAGVTVTAYDSAGTRVGQATTGADGTYTLTASTVGTVRVEFSTPSGYESSFRGSQSGTSVQFVSTDASGIDFALGKAALYCQDNPELVTCQFPLNNSMVANATFPGARVLPTALDRSMVLTKEGQAQRATAGTASTQTTTVASGDDLGAVYGVAVDRQRNVFYGTYVKRHSPYGPGSNGTNGAANWIYRVNLDNPGSAEAFIRLGVNTLPAHSSAAPTAMGSQPAYAVDGNRNLSPGQPGYSDVYSQVGRVGLGDLDTTPDGRTLLAVEMTETDPKLWVVPLSGTGSAVTAGTPVAHSIPAPSTFNGSSCVGTWHPMGIGVRESTILVGGVCGAEATATTGSNTTQAVAFVLSFDRDSGAFTTVAALPMNYWRARVNNSMMETFQPAGSVESGMWHNWNDGAPPVAIDIYNMVWSKPMLADIEIDVSGDLTLAFRDRYMDQENPANTVRYESPLSGSPEYIDFGMGVGDLIRMCRSGGGYVMESNGTCNGVRGANQPKLLLQDLSKRPNSPLFFFSGYAPWHAYNNIGGLTTLPGSRLYWSTVWDVDDWYQLGVMAFGPCPDRAADSGSCGPVPSGGSQEGSIVGGVAFGRGGFAVGGRPSATEGLGSGAFRKGNGLGDLELVCDAAPVQIGNRVWIDTNRDGIQGAGEPSVGGVTVRLYDAVGALVATTTTGADGTYYFQSTSTGAGGNVASGLRMGEAYTVRFDNTADYAAGGPLHGYSLTVANATAAGGDSAIVNSKATMVDGHPRITVAARQAGQNNHTFDVGFVRDESAAADLVAIGNHTWVDVNRNGLQGEQPLAGVKVVLLNAKGKRAKNAAGEIVPVKTTTRRGYYVFDGLSPGRYRVRFILPAGYRFTSTGASNAKRNSNPRATKANPLVGLTPVFRVHAAVRGNTVRNRNAKINATYIDPTIDAGVVRWTSPGEAEGVTG